MEPSAAIPARTELSTAQRVVILFAAFLGWTGAGMEMSTIPARPAAIHFLKSQAGGSESTAKPPEDKVGLWTSYYNASFLLGAAAGGLLFGAIGDRVGRVKAMSLSILCFAGFAGVASQALDISQLVMCRFLSGLGVGGIWPTGVALAMEAWAGRREALVAGVIGTAANVGLSLMALICSEKTYKLGGWAWSTGRNVTPDDWRWVMLVGATPAVVGLLIPFFVCESPAWKRKSAGAEDRVPAGIVFRPPYLKRTLIGIILGTVPLFGGWGSINWVVNWADSVGHSQSLKADTQFMRSSGAIFGSLIGGWLAIVFGRRTTYFFICLASLLMSGFLFWFLTPTHWMFLPWIFLTGVIATTAFGWLPLYLPELFPTEVRATGSGVTFNFGRIITVGGVLGTGALLSLVDGDYARCGRVTHLIFLIGMIAILFAPDTTKGERGA